MLYYNLLSTFYITLHQNEEIDYEKQIIRSRALEEFIQQDAFLSARASYDPSEIVKIISDFVGTHPLSHNIIYSNIIPEYFYFFNGNYQRSNMYAHEFQIFYEKYTQGLIKGCAELNNLKNLRTDSFRPVFIFFFPFNFFFYPIS